MIDSVTNVPIDKIESDFLKKHEIELYVQREDLLHPEISGNKWRKLMYNLLEYQKGNYKRIITFGGAFSNHIAATAALGKKYQIPTIGIIRGEKVENSTLSKATNDGMQLKFISREMYKTKNDELFLKNLQTEYPHSLLIPEGGSNKFGVKGCTKITEVLPDFDVIICAVGTGATLAGIIAGLSKHQEAIGIPVLKNANFLYKDVQQYLDEINCKNTNWKLDLDYHLGGYARYDNNLVSFINRFYKETGIKLDPIYTGKMMFATYELIKEKSLFNKRVIAVHTGGLQGVKGFEERYKKPLFT